MILAERIRELAENHAATETDANEEWAAIIESAILAGIRAFCEQEPSEAMMKEGADFLPVTPGSATNKCAGHVYEAMMQRALAELEARNAR